MTTLPRRLLVLLLALLAYRMLAVVPLPFLAVGAPGRLAVLGSSSDLGLLTMFRGGPLTAGSIVALGLTPMVTASLLVQLAGRVVPSLRMKEHPDPDRATARLTRAVALPIAVVQGVQLLHKLASIRAGRVPLFPMTVTATFVALVALTAGSLLLSFLAGVISRHGLGNGTTFLLMAAAAASDASSLRAVWRNQPSALPYLAVAFVAVAAVATFGVSARFRLPVLTARVDEPLPRATVLPFRFAGSGAAPLIVASSFVGVVRFAVARLVPSLSSLLAARWAIPTLLIPLVVMSAFAFTRATTPVEELHDDLVKLGRFVPGVIPGPQTEKLLLRLQRRISSVSALLLVPFIVLAPLVGTLTGVPLTPLVGTGVLIAVTYLSDVLDQSARLRRIRLLPVRHGITA